MSGAEDFVDTGDGAPEGRRVGRPVFNEETAEEPDVGDEALKILRGFE